jgi:hypothetical protein
MKRIARCCCREIGVEVEGLPWLHGVCHCDNCKRRTGSAFGVSAYFEDNQIVSYFGEPRLWARKGTRFGDQERYFCGNCGTTLYWRATEIKGTGVAGGCFTDDPLPEPTMTINQGDYVYDWVSLPDHWDRTELED